MTHLIKIEDGEYVEFEIEEEVHDHVKQKTLTIYTSWTHPEDFIWGEDSILEPFAVTYPFIVNRGSYSMECEDVYIIPRASVDKKFTSKELLKYLMEKRIYQFD